MSLSEQYTQEEINLYNPAYCAALLFESMREYEALSGNGMHCSFPFLVIPMCTNPQVSGYLPAGISTPIAGWVADNEGVLVGFPASVTAFIQIVESALSFLIEKKAIELSVDGQFIVTDDKLAKKPSFITKNNDFNNAYRTAGMLGRWFASAASVEGVFTQLGVKP